MTGYSVEKSVRSSLALFVIMLCSCFAVPGMAAQRAAPETVSTDQLSKEIDDFLGREIAAHIADLRSLDPPQERVVGALTVGEFSWGTFMRAVATYSAASGEKSIGGRDLAGLIGKIGLIESRRGGKTFAQLYAAMALRHFGKDLKTNAVWQSLNPQEQEEWRSLLDLSRFYDSKTKRVINLPENYFGVAARIACIDYQLGIITDRSFVNELLDRAAEQFTKGSLYSDDALPAGRFDRYSNEYARFIYDAAEDIDRKDLMAAMQPTLTTQMRTWWDLLSPDGYGYPWGRSLGAISYMDTMEIVGFLGRHPQFRPAPLPQLASAYYVAWKWLRNDYLANRHLLNVFGFGRGNYSYINPEREWQQTTAFFGKIAGANADFAASMHDEDIASFSPHLQLPEVARFEYFRKGPRAAGVWLVRRPEIRFVLPITSGTQPGISDYLPAPYDLIGFAPPVEQFFPTMTPYLELEDGRVIVAGDGADEIIPSADGLSLRAIWKRWAVRGAKAGQIIDPGITADVTWKIAGNTLVRTETISASRPTTIRHFWVAVPTTAANNSSRLLDGQRVDHFNSDDGSLEVTVSQSKLPLSASLKATGNSAFGRGSRGAVPLYLDLDANNFVIEPNKPVQWTLQLKVIPAASTNNQTVAVGDGGQR